MAVFPAAPGEWSSGMLLRKLTRAVSSRRNRSAAFFVVAVNVHGLPNLVQVVGVAAHERVGGGTVPGIDDENASGRRLAVIRDERAGRDHVNIVAFGRIEMYPVRTIE